MGVWYQAWILSFAAYLGEEVSFWSTILGSSELLSEVGKPRNSSVSLLLRTLKVLEETSKKKKITVVALKQIDVGRSQNSGYLGGGEY